MQKIIKKNPSFIKKIAFALILFLLHIPSLCASNVKECVAKEQSSLGQRIWEPVKYACDKTIKVYSFVKTAHLCAKGIGMCQAIVAKGSVPIIIATVKTGAIATATAVVTSPVTVPALAATGTSYGLYKGYYYMYPTAEDQAKQVTQDLKLIQTIQGQKKIEIEKSFAACLLKHKGLSAGAAGVPGPCQHIAFDYANCFGDKSADAKIAQFNSFSQCKN